MDSILVARPERANDVAYAQNRERFRNDLVALINRRLDAMGRDGDGLGIRVARTDVVASIPAGVLHEFRATVRHPVQLPLITAEAILTCVKAAILRLVQAGQLQTSSMKRTARGKLDIQKFATRFNVAASGLLDAIGPDLLDGQKAD